MLKKLLTKMKYNNSNRVFNSLNYSSKTKVSNDIESIPESIIQIKEKLNGVFSGTNDFIIREVTLCSEPNTTMLIIYIDGMVNINLLNENILKPVMNENVSIYFQGESTAKDSNINILKKNILTCSQIEEIKDFHQIVNKTLEGNVILYIDGTTVALSINLMEVKSRDIAEPLTDAVIRGPREGFTELLSNNKVMIRRIIKNSNLKFEDITIGQQTNTTVTICYIKGITNEQIIETLRNRLNKIDTDAVLESSYLEEFIEDAPFSVFPTIGAYEKPDVICAKLLEGRVAILCDGSPFVLTVPYLLIESIQTAEDYYVKPLVATFYRVIRIIGLFISTNLPAMYLALISFHQQVIPFKLLLTITSSREKVPYSAFMESFLMLLIFEILRESGIRMPRPAGSTVSFVGALVLGQSAVQAGLVSTPMVIVTAITAIGGFISGSLLGAIPIIRLILLVVSNFMGLLGIMIVNIMLLIHLSSIRSFDVPYLSPFSSFSKTELKDTVVRVPLWAMLTRPRSLTWGKMNNVKYRVKNNFRKKIDDIKDKSENNSPKKEE
ncbi:spore germination protein KA [Clostridium tetanomorphum]|uniref:Spore germination protein n=1 Tax=Clostridium tetanomorphum TaxID=1553 RepID=A0A923ECW5_CLOTT|nr:spore germination protein [Clostridium tetanomorphum]KAJ48728.1 GerA spore germination protein [Clostridium tetanomorphum DSM 665]KAJ53102.1 GerA spore germination protein [Clostridium tetanomorphum DSM 665]MBC2398789.1 spore germination protein [Clostridium tetanomorphum]MBP1863552.1 spore germination protein KA [Clostridium tetanomorphum]NRS83651.1 spore germination protein KA [Clostridium tetanomorphum]